MCFISINTILLQHLKTAVEKDTPSHCSRYAASEKDNSESSLLQKRHSFKVIWSFMLPYFKHLIQMRSVHVFKNWFLNIHHLCHFQDFNSSLLFGKLLTLFEKVIVIPS